MSIMTGFADNTRVKLACSIVFGSLLASAWTMVYASHASFDPCGGVKPEDAASILKVPLADIDGPKTLKTFTCYYHSKRHPYTTLSFNLYAEASAAKAVHDLDSIKEGLAFLSTIKAVKNLGDEAYRAPDSRARRLLMRKGRYLLDVTTPGDAAAQLRITRIVLAHLP